MGKCTALGVASMVREGACENELSIDDSVKLMEEAIDNAQSEAQKACAQGCICSGKGMPVGPPVCYQFHLGEKLFHRWVLTVTFDGDCECPEPPVAPGPKTEITGIRPGSLRTVIESLPEKPIGNGRCQLVKRRDTPGGGWSIGCAGTCARKGARCPRNPQMWMNADGTVGLRCACG